MQRTRRAFLADVGKGMLVASVGPGLAADLGLAPAWAAEAPGALNFGDLEPLVCLMQETTPQKLLPILVERLRGGADLGRIVAGAPAVRWGAPPPRPTPRTWGGEHYVASHTRRPLVPPSHMARELPAERQPL